MSSDSISIQIKMEPRSKMTNGSMTVVNETDVPIVLGISVGNGTTLTIKLPEE